MPPPHSCDTSRLDDLGYVWFGMAGSPAGTADRFYQTFALTDREAASIQAIAAGSTWFSDFSFYEPIIRPTIPAPNG